MSTAGQTGTSLRGQVSPAGSTAAPPSGGTAATAAVSAPQSTGPSYAPAAPTSGQQPGHSGHQSAGQPGTQESGQHVGQPGPRPAPPAPRRVKLTVSRLDPWSVMKMSFLISVAIGIAGVVMMAVLWLILSGMGVFTEINSVIDQLQSANAQTAQFDLMNYIGFGRVVSLAIVIGVVDVILLTALATLGAFLYNVCSSLVGGLQVTLTDD